MINRRLNLYRKSLRQLAIGVALGTIPLVISAQQPGVPGVVTLEEEAVEPVRQFGVELIIFEFTDRGSAGTELFAPDPIPKVLPEELIFSDETEELNLGVAIIPDGEVPGDDVQIKAIEERATDPKPDVFYEGIPLDEIRTHEQAGLKLLPPEQYVLDDVYSHLRRLDAYRPILRTAWVQPTLEKDDTVPIKLRRLGDPPLRLDGTITLYLNRFLHLVVDLSLEEKSLLRVPVDDNHVRQFGDRPRERFDWEDVTPIVTYRIEEDRIVRNGELRYYDHPRFGAIAKIWRVEEKVAEGAALDAIPNR
jgi:hypothetical protein